MDTEAASQKQAEAGEVVKGKSPSPSSQGKPKFKKRPAGSARTPIAAPDGGWGWVVVLSSFTISVIVDGIGYTFGIVKGELDNHFQTASSTTAWAGSLLNGVYLSTGPLASALSNKFGCRIVCCVGSAIAAIFVFISGFSTNVEMLLITYGVMGGVGFGLMYLPAIVMVGYYFDKRRALATGIAVCGSGIGTVILSPVGSGLLAQFGWGGTHIILAGFILNGIVFGLLYRPLTHKEEVVLETLDEPEQSYVMQSIIKEKRSRYYSTDEPDEDVAEPVNGVAANEAAQEAHGGKHEEEHLMDDHRGGASVRSRNPSLKMTRSRNVSVRSVTVVEEKKLMERPDALYTGSIKVLPEYKECHSDMETYVQSMRSLHTTGSASQDPNSVLNIIREMFDVTLFKSPTVLLICASGFLSFTALYTPFVYAPAKSESLGESISRTSWIITALGATNTVCRVLVGFIIDLPFVDCVLINTLALILAGILTCLVCVFNSWNLLMMYAALFGVCMAAFVTLRSIVIANLLGVNKLNNAYGLLSLCQGIAVIIGSPLAGAMYDATGSYNAPFIASGSMFIIAGLLSWPMRRVHAWEQSRIVKDHTMMTICTDEPTTPTA